MTTPESVLKLVERMKHTHDVQALIDVLTTQPLSPTGQREVLARIMYWVACGRVTPREARILTRAVRVQ